MAGCVAWPGSQGQAFCPFLWSSFSRGKLLSQCVQGGRGSRQRAGSLLCLSAKLKQAEMWCYPSKHVTGKTPRGEGKPGVERGWWADWRSEAVLQVRTETHFQSTSRRGACCAQGGQGAGPRHLSLFLPPRAQDGAQDRWAGHFGVRVSSSCTFRGQLGPVKPGRAPRGDT